MLKTLVILASTREGRTGEKIANWFMDQVNGKYPDFEFELVDLKELNLPWFETGNPSAMDKKYNDEKIQQWSQKVDGADAFIVITPEYNHGYSAPLKNALDHLFPEWAKKPMAFVSYGGSAGGARSVEQLRQVAVELEMAPIRIGVHIVRAWSELDESGNLQNPAYAKMLESLMQQLKWWGEALQTARQKPE